MASSAIRNCSDGIGRSCQRSPWHARLQPFDSRFRKPSLRPFRALMYAGLGSSSLVFVCHGLLRFGYEEQRRRMSLGWMRVIAAVNLEDVVAYAARAPEWFQSSKFNIVGNSHQILHSLSSLPLWHIQEVF